MAVRVNGVGGSLVLPPDPRAGRGRRGSGSYAPVAGGSLAPCGTRPSGRAGTAPTIPAASSTPTLPSDAREGVRRAVEDVLRRRNPGCVVSVGPRERLQGSRALPTAR